MNRILLTLLRRFLFIYRCINLFFIKLHPFLYNHVYGRFWVRHIKHRIILFRLRHYCKYTRYEIVCRFYRMIAYKEELRRKRQTLDNMKIIVETSDRLGISQHILVEKMMPYDNVIIKRTKQSRLFPFLRI